VTNVVNGTLLAIRFPYSGRHILSVLVVVFQLLLPVLVPLYLKPSRLAVLEIGNGFRLYHTT
jgi:hypothetical protein